MKRNYIIGLLAAVFMLVSLLGLGYKLSYQYAWEHRQDAQENGAEEQSVHTEGEAVQSEGYVLSVLHGYVVVYYADRHTIFEMTEIPLDTLPKEVQGELLEGKQIQDIDKLYAFLENYSS